MTFRGMNHGRTRRLSPESRGLLGLDPSTRTTGGDESAQDPQGSIQLASSRLSVIFVVGVEAQLPRYDVSGDVGERAVVAEGVRFQPDQRQADADTELGGDHAGGLVDDVLEVSARFQLGGELPGGRMGLEGKKWFQRRCRRMTSAVACCSSLSGPGSSQ